MRREEGPWLGLGREAGPPPPLHPKEHMSKWGGGPSVLALPPPTAPNERRSPSPRGCSHPNPAVHSVVLSSPMAQGPGVGVGPIRLSWTVAVTWVYWSILGPKVCAICFSEG